MNTLPVTSVRWVAVSLAFVAILAGGCAFDIVSVKQNGTTFTALSAKALDFSLLQDVTVPIGTGFPTRLKSGTRWHQVGIVDQGAVFTTHDQIVTVEASNIHEAQLVISKGELIGFYLPIERTFTPATKPVSLVTKPTESTP